MFDTETPSGFNELCSMCMRRDCERPKNRPAAQDKNGDIKMGMKKIPLLNDTQASDPEPNVSLKKEKFDHTAPEGAPLTEDDVFEALRGVRDPELPVDIVSLGLVYNASITPGNKVHVSMTLTTPGCGMGRQIASQAEAALMDVGATDVLVEIVWDPPWNPDMMTDEAKQRLGVG